MSRPEYGETWVYESLVGAIPGIDLSGRGAVALQFVGFETLVLAMGWYYELPAGTLAGTAAVAVAAAGSVLMLRMGSEIRSVETPAPYRALLFGSSVEVVLGMVAFVGLVTYLFVVDPASPPSLVDSLLGREPPPLATSLALFVLWDLCYRIGTGWWACVVGCWRSYRYDFEGETASALRSVDRLNAGFGILQLALVPFVLDHPLLAVAVAGYVGAVVAASALSLALLSR